MIAPVKMRQRTDCGVAALAMATGTTYDESLAAVRGAGVDCRDYFGVARDEMQAALTALGYEGRESGCPLPAAGDRGLLYCHQDREWECVAHWLAWERDEAGVITIHDPAGKSGISPGNLLPTFGWRLIAWTTVTVARDEGASR